MEWNFLTTVEFHYVTLAEICFKIELRLYYTDKIQLV